MTTWPSTEDAIPARTEVPLERSADLHGSSRRSPIPPQRDVASRLREEAADALRATSATALCGATARYQLRSVRRHAFVPEASLVYYARPPAPREEVCCSAIRCNIARATVLKARYEAGRREARWKDRSRGGG